MHVEFELAHRLADAFCRFNHAFRSRIDESHHKFFAAIASHNVNFLTDFATNCRCNALDDFVTNRVSIRIVHALEVVNVHHQDADVILLAVGTYLFGAERFLQRAVVHEPREAIARRKVLVPFDLESSGIRKASNTGKCLEEFLFVILIAVRVTAFKADGKFSRLGIRFRCHRHYKQLTQFHIALFGIVQARHVIGITRSKRAEHRAVSHERKHKDTLVRQRKRLIDKLFRIHADAINNSASAFLRLVKRKDCQAVERHILLDVLEHLLVDVLHRHRLEELALVAVKRTELLLFNVVLCRDIALEAHHENHMRHKHERLGFGFLKRIRLQRVHQNCTKAAFIAIQDRHTHQRADSSVFDVVREALADKQITFQNAANPRTQELAQDARVFGNLCARVNKVLHIALESPEPEFIHTAAICKNRERIRIRHQHLEAAQNIPERLIDIRICTGPNLVHAERRVRFVRIRLDVRKFIADVRRHNRRESSRTLAALDNRNHSRATREARAVHDGE